MPRHTKFKVNLSHSIAALDHARRYLGASSHAEFADRLGASTALVSLWFAAPGSARCAPVTIDWAVRIASLTGNAVTVAEILPDHARLFHPHAYVPPKRANLSKAELEALSEASTDPDSFV